MLFSKNRVSVALVCIWSLLFSFTIHADNPAGIKAEPDNQGNIVFTQLINDLSLNQTEILEVAKKYLEEAYKPTKFSDIKVLSDKGIVYGKGCLKAFYTENKIASSSVYSLDFFLRFDCKDGKARVQLIAKDYSIKSFSDIKGDEESSVAIITTPPFGDGKKNFKKVYSEVEPLANKIIEAATTAIKSATSEPEVEDW